MTADEKITFVDETARQNVRRVVRQVLAESPALSRLVADGRLAVVGAFYDIASGRIEFLADEANVPDEAEDPVVE
jgi:carbonic anhydrase